MPANTPAWNLPYPLGSDPIADGDDIIKALATALDGTFRVGVVQAGTDGQGNGHVDFVPPFAKQLLAVVIVDATDPAITNAVIVKIQWTACTKEYAVFRAHQPGGAAIPNVPNLRMAFIAFGN